jgi:outer membrane protein TolC
LAPFEQTDNERAVEQRRAQVAMARRGLEQAALELGLYLRDADGQPRPPSLDELPPDFPSLPTGPRHDHREVERAHAARPEPKKLNLQRQQNDVERALANNQLAPGIDVQVMGSQDIGPANPDRPDLRDPAVQVMLQLDIPLQNRVMRGRADALHATAARLSHQEQFAKEKVAAEVRDARSGINRALERIEAARREVSLAFELERSERIRFEEGDSHLLIVNLREQQTAEAELRQVEALLDYYRAEADLIAALGG